MVMRGECIQTGAPYKCFDCHQPLRMRVMQSAAGYYIGTGCENKECKTDDGKVGGGQFGEPHSRESGYYKTEKAAQKALDSDNYYRY